jgi:hypothetical protein
VTSARSAEFVQTERKGILPRILQNLCSSAQGVPRSKLCDDPFERGVLDGSQLACEAYAYNSGTVSFAAVPDQVI